MFFKIYFIFGFITRCIALKGLHNNFLRISVISFDYNDYKVTMIFWINFEESFSFIIGIFMRYIRIFSASSSFVVVSGSRKNRTSTFFFGVHQQTLECTGNLYDNSVNALDFNAWKTSLCFATMTWKLVPGTPISRCPTAIALYHRNKNK